MVNKVVNINDLVKIKLDCHYDVNEDNNISAVVESDYIITNKNTQKEVEKCAVAEEEGLESNSYRDYDPNLDYKSIDIFLKDILCIGVVTGYALVLGQKYEVKGITFVLEEYNDNFNVRLKVI